ncbi:hypothetical protein Xen7305DRAFT_00010760 [Xenococcus sp. PCC 7305]|uniref:hypothetical protein n=1 Tax=Xenococcus sp. PCC 7305 TaxID=102125 RepID=UPI0002ABB01E|nr:hypothetical protein [Xenococcus sp. PCC 7305]ELS01373.1 hypothetical protein Xen7305DRAFT_00010760 [Xenococcus sp. PCC 7305]
MTGQVLDRNSNGLLVLIIPMAFAIVIICQLWPVLLGLTFIIVSWKAWQGYQWRKWSQLVNPFFNNLVKENRGYLTPLDLSLKAGLSSKSAKAYLERKAEEYGTQPKKVKDKGVVYYFPTASALGRIFDDSDPFGDDSEEEEVTTTSTSPQSISTSSTTKEPNSVSFKEITQLAQEKAKTATATSTLDKPEIQSMNQADLAKRLDVNSSTVGRQKTKSEAEFAIWSLSKDPEGISWKYDVNTNEFVPSEA